MNFLQLKQAGSAIMVLIGGWLVNAHVFSADDWTTLSGAIQALVGAGVTIAGVVWPIWQASHAKQLENTAAIPAVTAIKVDENKATPAVAAVVNDHSTPDLEKVQAL